MNYYYDQDDYQACVDPAILSPPRGVDYLSPVLEDDGPGGQLLSVTSPDDTFSGLPTTTSPWFDGGDSTGLGAKPTSASTKGGRRRSGRKKTSVPDVAETSAAVRPEEDTATRKLSMRERNRMAACRSRLKKSKDIKHLEEEERLASIKRECLSAYVAGLQSEVFELENMLLAHRDCSCVVIQKYFKVRSGLESSGDMEGGGLVPAEGQQD